MGRCSPLTPEWASEHVEGMGASGKERRVVGEAQMGSPWSSGREGQGQGRELLRGRRSLDITDFSSAVSRYLGPRTSAAVLCWGQCCAGGGHTKPRTLICSGLAVTSPVPNNDCDPMDWDCSP